MNVYVARQPIFNRKMRVYGYELLYRKSVNNYYEGTDDDQSTIALINDSFFVFGFKELVEETRGFINFSQNLLLGELAYMLPKEKVVIEILERVEATKEVVEACRKLKQRGYMLALDDFVLEQYSKEYLPLIELADIIKVEFPAVSGKDLQMLIDKYKSRILFLAEKVETRKEYLRAVSMGFKLFQGYYFSRPVMTGARDIGALNVNLVQILNELNREEINYNSISAIIQQDVGLSYKFLKMADSVYYGTRYRIKNIQQGLILMGTDEIRRWVCLMMMRGVQCPENAELVKNSVIRGKMLSLIARELKIGSESDYFIGGMFSSIDVLLNTKMEKALQGLPLSREVRAALEGRDNRLRWHLDIVLALEQARWESLNTAVKYPKLTAQKYMSLYMEAIRWQKAQTK